jgi:hypothetical protein
VSTAAYLGMLGDSLQLATEHLVQASCKPTPVVVWGAALTAPYQFLFK